MLHVYLSVYMCCQLTELGTMYTNMHTGLSVSQGTIYVTIHVPPGDVIVKALPDPTSPEQWSYQQAAKEPSWAKPGAGAWVIRLHRVTETGCTAIYGVIRLHSQSETGTAMGSSGYTECYSSSHSMFVLISLA